MTQSTFALPNQSGSAYRAAVNGALQALAGWNWGPTAPIETYSLMGWVDTSAAPTLIGKQRNYANSAWLSIFVIDAAGFRPYYNGAVLGTAATLTAGAAVGNVPVLQNVGGTPGFAALDGSQLTGLPSAGRGVVVSELTASNSASLEFSDGLDGTYDELALEFDSLLPATDGDSLYLRINGDSGATAYKWGIVGAVAAVSALSQGDAADSEIALCSVGGGFGIGTAAGESGLSGELRFASPDVTKIHQFNGAVRWITTAAGQAWATVGANWQTAAAITSLSLTMSSGNIATGTARLRGIAK